MSFEGPEKKLKITRLPGTPSLRSYGAEAWDRFVRASGASVLSRREGETWDGYILSESSLFVSDDACTIITCGRTNPVDAIPTLLQILSRDTIGQVLYERKSEHFPDLQPTRWTDDLARLETEFPHGGALRLGEGSYHVDVFHAVAPGAEVRDATIEVLMHHPDPTACGPFMGDPASRDPEALSAIVSPLFAGFATDPHAFEPDGFSLNAVRATRYAALHVTPEAEGSYVSYETQAPADALGAEDVEELIGRLATAFRPRTIEALFFAPGRRVTRHLTPPPSYRAGSWCDVPCAGYALHYAAYRAVSERTR